MEGIRQLRKVRQKEAEKALAYVMSFAEKYDGPESPRPLFHQPKQQRKKKKKKARNDDVIAINVVESPRSPLQVKMTPPSPYKISASYLEYLAAQRQESSRAALHQSGEESVTAHAPINQDEAASKIQRFLRKKRHHRHRLKAKKSLETVTAKIESPNPTGMRLGMLDLSSTTLAVNSRPKLHLQHNSDIIYSSEPPPLWKVPLSYSGSEYQIQISVGPVRAPTERCEFQCLLRGSGGASNLIPMFQVRGGETESRVVYLESHVGSLYCIEIFHTGMSMATFINFVKVFDPEAGKLFVFNGNKWFEPDLGPLVLTLSDTLHKKLLTKPKPDIAVLNLQGATPEELNEKLAGVSRGEGRGLTVINISLNSSATRAAVHVQIDKAQAQRYAQMRSSAQSVIRWIKMSAARSRYAHIIREIYHLSTRLRALRLRRVIRPRFSNVLKSVRIILAVCRRAFARTLVQPVFSVSSSCRLFTSRHHRRIFTKMRNSIIAIQALTRCSLLRRRFLCVVPLPQRLRAAASRWTYISNRHIWKSQINSLRILSVFFRRVKLRDTYLRRRRALLRWRKIRSSIFMNVQFRTAGKIFDQKRKAEASRYIRYRIVARVVRNLYREEAAAREMTSMCVRAIYRRKYGEAIRRVRREEDLYLLLRAQNKTPVEALLESTLVLEGAARLLSASLRRSLASHRYSELLLHPRPVSIPRLSIATPAISPAAFLPDPKTLAGVGGYGPLFDLLADKPRGALHPHTADWVRVQRVTEEPSLRPVAETPSKKIYSQNLKAQPAKGLRAPPAIPKNRSRSVSPQIEVPLSLRVQERTSVTQSRILKAQLHPSFH